jgi:outer membrane receptor protein involved in Fe transport
MKFLLPAIICCLLAPSFVSAQVEREPPPSGGDGPVLRVRENKLYGKVLDARTSKGIEAASVQLFSISNKPAKVELAGGMLSRANGDFNLEKLPAADSFRLIISAIGYETVIQTFSTGNEGKGENRNKAAMEKDLGNILLAPAIKEMDAVTVTAQRPGLVMGIDRKIFNVEKSLVATGGTGLDIMKNIPSVSVDVEGNVLLRNNAPLIFVDGRPTILTLDQIPADNIERVELITNPSAKFDAASGAGIINIILKKNKRLGLNGIISAGAGSPDILNGNISVSMREGKFNYFVSGNYNQSGGRANSETRRENKDNGVTKDYFNQLSKGDRLRRFGSIRFGADFFLDNRNTISLTQNLVQGKNTNEETQEQENLTINRQLSYYGQRYAESGSRYNRSNTQLNYTHKFPQPGKELTAGINFNGGNGTDNSDISNAYFNPGGTEYKPKDVARNDGSNENRQWNFQLDYTNPKTENKKLEAGIRSYINDYESQYNAFAVFSNGSSVKLPISNNYAYKEWVNAAYFTYADQWKTLSYQFGLRAEHSKFDGELIDSAFQFGYQYPRSLSRIWDALFPSLFVSKQVNEDVEMQVNYSRRIRRPNFWQLNPFIDITDPVNLRQGNPELRPEFVNSFEFNYSHSYGKGNNFLGVVYYRNNPGDITRYSDTISNAQYLQLDNAAVDPNAILNTFINAQSTNSLGLELTLQQKLGNRFDITPTFDMQYRRVNATVKELNLSNEGFTWEGKLIINYKTGIEKRSVFRNFSMQVIGEYESAEVMAQGRSRPEYSVDLAVRKDFLKDKKANFTFSIGDVFNTLRFGNIYDTENFYQDAWWRRNIRSFRVVLSYKFGKADFSFRRNRDNGNEGEE